MVERSFSHRSEVSLYYRYRIIVVRANLLLVCGTFGVSVVHWCYKTILRNSALFLYVVLCKWTSIASENYVTLLWLRSGAFWVSFGSATGKKIGRKTCVFRFPQLGFPTNPPSALWYVLVGAHSISAVFTSASLLRSTRDHVLYGAKCFIWEGGCQR